MRILHIYRDLLAKGGIPHQTRRLVEGQSRLGHEVVTVSLKGDAGESFKNSDPAVEIMEIRPTISGLRNLRGVLRTQKPDVVHFTGLWIPVHQLWAWEVLRAGVPYVVSPHGSLSPYGMAVRFGGKKACFYYHWAKTAWHWCLDIPLLKYAAGIHAHSRYEAELIEAAGMTNVFVVPAGVDADWVIPESGERQRPHKPIIFLHLGRLDIYHKGLDLVVEALGSLVKAGLGKKCKAIFAGPTVNNSRQVLQQQAAQLGSGILEVREAVWGQDKEKIWLEADYFLNLYRYAGMALAPCEATGHCMPLIASREGSIGDWTANADMGFVVPLDSGKLCDAFKAILQTPDREYKRLSENARKFALMHSWEKVAEATVEGYHTALTSRKSARVNQASPTEDSHELTNLGVQPPDAR